MSTMDPSSHQTTTIQHTEAVDAASMPILKRLYLNQLATELIQKIAGYLDENDLLALRVTSKLLNFVTKELHIKAIYETRSLYLEGSSIYTMLKIAKSEMNVYVHNVEVISTQHYQLNPEKQKSRTAYLEDHGFHADSDETPFPEDKILRLGIEMIDKTQSRTNRNKYLNHIYLGNLLGVIFSNLPSLRSIRFVPDRKRLMLLDRAKFDSIYPPSSKVHDDPGARIEDDPLELLLSRRYYYNDEEQWNMVMQVVLAEAPPHLHTISITHGQSVEGAVPLRFFRKQGLTLPVFQKGLNALRVLHLRLEALQHILYEDGSYYVEDRERFLWGWIEYVGANLEELGLYFQDIDNRASNRLPSLDLQGKRRLFCFPRLSKLKRLTLHSIFLDVEVWRDLVSLSSFPQLEELEILRCTMSEPDTDWFEALQHLYLPKNRKSIAKLLIKMPRAPQAHTSDQAERYIIYKDPPPDLEIRRLQGHGSFVFACTVSVPNEYEVEIEEEGVEATEGSKTSKVIPDFREELICHDTHESFWEAIKNGLKKDNSRLWIVTQQEGSWAWDLRVAGVPWHQIALVMDRHVKAVKRYWLRNFLSEYRSMD